MFLRYSHKRKRIFAKFVAVLEKDIFSGNDNLLESRGIKIRFEIDRYNLRQLTWFLQECIAIYILQTIVFIKNSKYSYKKRNFNILLYSRKFIYILLFNIIMTPICKFTTSYSMMYGFN